MPKPAAGTPINAGHALASGLVRAWAFLEGSGTAITDSVSGTSTGTLSSSSLWSTDANGPILANPGVQTLISSAASLPTSAVTVVVVYRKRDTTNRASSAFGEQSATASARMGVHLPYSDGTVYWDFGGSTGGTSRLSVGGLTIGTSMSVWGFSAGAAGMEIWQNGVLRASQAGHATRTAPANPFVIGGGNEATADVYDIASLYVYSRQLSSSEQQSIAADPWQMFAKPSARRADFGRRALLPC